MYICFIVLHLNNKIYVAFAQDTQAVFIHHFCTNVRKMWQNRPVPDILAYTAKHMSNMEYPSPEGKVNLQLPQFA